MARNPILNPTCYCLLGAIERLNIITISQRSLKSMKQKHFCVRYLCVRWSLSHLSCWQIWSSMKEYWEIITRSMRSWSTPWVFSELSLNIHWAFVEHRLNVDWEIASLGDHWEMVLDWVKTLQRPWRSMDGHWEIIERSRRTLGTLWKIVERSGHFSIAQESLKRALPLSIRGFRLCRRMIQFW